jgi:CHAT domain-containing protein
LHDLSTIAPNKIHFVSLSNTRVEGEIIGDMLGVHPWVDDQGLESRIKSCKSLRILHIATHGFFRHDLQQSPSIIEEIDRLSIVLVASDLAMAGANTWAKGGTLPKEAEDGILNALDVSSMNIMDTELVVLSACEIEIEYMSTSFFIIKVRKCVICLSRICIVAFIIHVEQ